MYKKNDVTRAPALPPKHRRFRQIYGYKCPSSPIKLSKAVMVLHGPSSTHKQQQECLNHGHVSCTHAHKSAQLAVRHTPGS